MSGRSTRKPASGPARPAMRSIATRRRAAWTARRGALGALATALSGATALTLGAAAPSLAWNPATGPYDMRAFRAGQGWTDATLEVDGRRLRWGMETPGGTVRFTLDFGEDGRWHEVGEIERGGQWVRFLEMDLRRTG